MPFLNPKVEPKLNNGDLGCGCHIGALENLRNLGKERLVLAQISLETYSNCQPKENKWHIPRRAWLALVKEPLARPRLHNVLCTTVIVIVIVIDHLSCRLLKLPANAAEWVVPTTMQCPRSQGCLRLSTT